MRRAAASLLIFTLTGSLPAQVAASSARILIMSVHRMTKRMPSGSWRSISSGDGMPTSKNFRFSFLRRRCGCWR